VAARVIGSRFAKPVARVALVAAGLVLLAVIGRASAAGALGFASPLPSHVDAVDHALAAPSDAGRSAEPTPSAPAPSPVTAAGAPVLAAAAPVLASAGGRGRATSDDPVVLNAAGVDDLRRLPGIGQKRADAILALRTRMGRFHAVEDLMKVKGIGRAMIRRLRPLVRLDPRPDAVPPAASGSAVASLDAGAGATPPATSR
jgi:competence protein ComEA